MGQHLVAGRICTCTIETAEDDTAHLTVPTGQVYIVKVADTVVKIGM